MTYRIEGSGQQWPDGGVLTAESAVGALERSHGVKMLCGEVVVYDARGERLTSAELLALAEAELA